MPNNITRQYQRRIKNPVELLWWSSFLEVWLGSQYTLSVEMLLDRFGQSNKFWKKSLKKNLGHPSVSALKVFLGMSWLNLPGTSLERQIRTSPARHFRTSPGRQIGTSPGLSNRIFRGRPGDVGGRRPRDILGTNIRRLGTYFLFFKEKIWSFDKCEKRFYWKNAGGRWNGKAPLSFAEYLQQTRRIGKEQSYLWQNFYKMNFAKVMQCY